MIIFLKHMLLRFTERKMDFLVDKKNLHRINQSLVITILLSACFQ